MTTTHSCLRVRLVTRHWPAANNSFSKSWDQAETEIIKPLACQTERTLRNCDSLLLQPETEQLGMVSSILITCTNMFYHFYNLFQLNKLESLSLEAIKCGQLINNFSIHKGGAIVISCFSKINNFGCKTWKRSMGTTNKCVNLSTNSIVFGKAGRSRDKTKWS